MIIYNFRITTEFLILLMDVQKVYRMKATFIGSILHGQIKGIKCIIFSIKQQGYCIENKVWKIQYSYANNRCYWCEIPTDFKLNLLLICM